LTRPDPPIDEPVFEEPWQASAFAIVVSLHEKQVFDWNEWAAALADVIASDTGSDPAYYAQWLKALEVLLQRKGIASGSDIERLADAWSRAAEATPHGQPIRLENDPLGILA
jgi:nitrile hydratase accessory protein